MRELAFADSSLMLDLAALARRLRIEGSALHLRAPQPAVLSVIELVRLHRLPGVMLEPAAPALA